MSSLKRSRPSALLERRVRPRREEDSEVEEGENFSEDGDSEAPSEEDQSDESAASEDEDANDNNEDVRPSAHISTRTLTD